MQRNGTVTVTGNQRENHPHQLVEGTGVSTAHRGSGLPEKGGELDDCAGRRSVLPAVFVADESA